MRRKAALWAVHVNLSHPPDGYGNMDPRQLLDAIRIEIDPHLSRAAREKWVFSEDLFSAAQEVITKWSAKGGKGKWEALHKLFGLLGFAGSNKRTSKPGITGKHPLKTEMEQTSKSSCAHPKFAVGVKLPPIEPRAISGKVS
ncbi:MAG: hypothetical protein QM784_00575 [Polyangiaceae bacterium]